MTCKVFLSYHGINIKSALEIVKQLELLGIDVIRYDPGLKWDDKYVRGDDIDDN